MAQTKDLRSAEGEIPTDGVSDLVLFAVSALAIFFSPLGYFGVSVGLLGVAAGQSFLLAEALEAVFFIVGIIPFVTLLSRGKYALSILLVVFAIFDIGLLFGLSVSFLP